MKRYPSCQFETGGDCAACSLSSRTLDCMGNPCNQLAYLRNRAGMTQAQLAEACEKHVMYVSKLECGKRDLAGISLSNAIAIADALGLEDVRELLGKCRDD